MDESVARFWAEFEAETGERALERAAGAWMAPGKDERGVWGLLVLCESSFRFRHLPSESWMSALFRAQRSSPPEKVDDIVIPFDSVTRVEEPRRGFLSRILGPGIGLFAVEWDSGGVARRESFTTDRALDFARALEARRPGGRAGAAG